MTNLRFSTNKDAEITLHKFNSTEEKFIGECIPIYFELLNTVDFKYRFLNLYSGENTTYLKTAYLSLIKSDFNFMLTRYRKIWFSSEIAYTVMGTRNIFMRDKFIRKCVNRNRKNSFIGCLAHEYMHVLGYGHSKFGSSKKSSLVYKVGSLLNKMTKEKLSGREFVQLVN